MHGAPGERARPLTLVPNSEPRSSISTRPVSIVSRACVGAIEGWSSRNVARAELPMTVATASSGSSHVVPSGNQMRIEPYLPDARAWELVMRGVSSSGTPERNALMVLAWDWAWTFHTKRGSE